MSLLWPAQVMLGVDRLDMIKGIPQKLLAFEKFLVRRVPGNHCPVPYSDPAAASAKLHCLHTP